MRRTSVLAGMMALAIATGLLLHGCQESPEPTSPDFAKIKPDRTLTVQGGGTGSGTVTAPQVGEVQLVCEIVEGQYAPEECTQTYGWKSTVTLTATPQSTSTFAGWSGAGDRLYHHGRHADRRLWRELSGRDPSAAHGHLGERSDLRRVERGLRGGRRRHLHGDDERGPHDDGRLHRAGRTFNGTSWSAPASMQYRRWYPTLVTLANGDVVAMAGNQAPNTPATYPERYNGSSWTTLTTASMSLPLYPRAFLEPKQGRIFVAGEGQPWFLNPSGTGQWSSGPTRVVSNRSYGSAVMLDSKVYYIGGGGGCPSLPQASAEVIDLAAATPAWSAVTPMKFGRRQTNATILPDGKVLVTGGTSACGFTTESGAVYAAEVYNPAANAWTTVANANVTRVYHSTALLLPDGRVLTTGSGDGAGVTQQFSYEIFSPPYLFKGARPGYNLGSSAMRYGQPFVVNTPNAASIVKVTPIRLVSTTHAFDMGQRLNTLTFTKAADGQSLTVTAPASGLIAPPGPYLLFIVNDRGVPSVAQTILVSQ